MLKNFNEVNLMQCAESNLEDLMSILRWNVKNRIFMFRISSDIIPFGSHKVNHIAWWERLKEKLAECGEFIDKNQIRVSMHPGQYTVLNSPEEEVALRSIADLEYHCRFLDALGVDASNKIILHVGGVYGDKAAAVQRFISNFGRLSEAVKKRLVIENDDKSYTIEEVLELCNTLSIPAVFDNLHHKLNPCSLSWNEILKGVRKTWKAEDGPVKLHYSDQDEDKKGGAHSRFVIIKNFLNYLESLGNLQADIMLEVKDKELSALKCVYSLDKDLGTAVRADQWAKYKYTVMEKNYAFYKRCNKFVNSNVPMAEVYTYIDECLLTPFDEGAFRNAAEHVYGYVKDKVSEKEKMNFQALLPNVSENRIKMKDFLQRLCKKYNVAYMNESYYFIY